MIAVALPGAFKPRCKLKHSRFEWRKILRNGRFENCSGGVEIVVSQPVSHVGRVRPPDIRLARDELVA